MWREVPGLMKRLKIGKVGSFDPCNGFGGVCWGWPSECKLSNRKAENIFWSVYKKKTLTVHQMKVVRKALAFAFELCGGEPLGNFAGVKGLPMREETLAAAKGSVIPTHIPTSRELKIGFTKEWSPDSPLCFLAWSSGLVCAHDAFLNGLRSREDVDRLKKSRTHQQDWDNGWLRTDFEGGRSKLCGAKKGTRPWGIWTTCFCKQADHQRPPPDFCLEIGEDGNPRDPRKVTWTTGCPLAALELMWQCQEEPRRYAKWLGNRYAPVQNIADPVACGIDWLESQGACTSGVRFDHNSGRKCFAHWARECQLEYHDIFQVVGDLQDVWRKSYDPDLPVSQYNSRVQSKDPSVCTAALRVLARRLLKRGKKFMPRLTRHERLLYADIKSRDGEEAANAAMWGDDAFFA